MHEFSLIADLLNKIQTISAENNNGRILSVKVRLGALSHISPDHFREHFCQATENTSLEGARLEIDVLTDETDPQAQEILLDSVDIEDQE